MTQNLQERLFKKYPKIFAGKHKPITESLMAFGIECDNGWYWIIDRLCQTIQGYIDINDYNNIPQIEATQVKEKFGGLKFYTNGGDKIIRGMIWLAEHLSESVCEVCGNIDAETLVKGSWYKTLCRKCAEELDYPIKPIIIKKKKF